MVFISHVESPLNNFRWGGRGKVCVPAGKPADFCRKKE